MTNNKKSDQELELALKSIEADLRLVVNNRSSRYNFVQTPEVDFACQEIGREIMHNHFGFAYDKIFNSNLNVYISGAVYLSGGHTREIEDWIKNTYKDRENIIIISGALKHSDWQQLENFKAQNIKVFYTDELGIVARIKWLQSLLLKLKPDAIFVSTTPTDLVALAALQPELVNKLYWNLSLDSGASIGLHLKPITKIIVKRPYFYFYLRDKLKLNNLTYIPFNRPDVVGKLDAYVSSDETKKIITASCTSTSYKIESEYKYRFIEVVPNILKITGGTHFHFGGISEGGLAKLQANLDKLGVPREKFVLIKYVPSLAKALIERDVDILLQTFPFGGGLVTIEALQAGKMIINNKNYATYLNNLSDFCYQDSFNWSKPEELYDYLRKLDRQEIIRQSKLSRELYEKNNDSAKLRLASDVNNMVGLEIDSQEEYIAKLYDYELDYYQKFVDEAKANYSFEITRKSLFTRLRNSLKKRYAKIRKKLFRKPFPSF